MSLDITGLFTGVMDHASTSGLFARVNGHEPKSSPGSGLTCAIWVDYIGPLPAASGLTSTTGYMVFMARIYNNMLAEPQDGIDPEIMVAVDALLAAYSGDFELGARVRNVDLMGQYGRSLSAQAGYINVGSSLYRAMDITIPLVINDLWTQGA